MTKAATAKSTLKKTGVKPKWLCVSCHKHVTSNSVECSKCKEWTHAFCAGIRLTKSYIPDPKWTCVACSPKGEPEGVTPAMKKDVRKTRSVKKAATQPTCQSIISTANDAVMDNLNSENPRQPTSGVKTQTKVTTFSNCSAFENGREKQSEKFETSTAVTRCSLSKATLVPSTEENLITALDLHGLDRRQHTKLTKANQTINVFPVSDSNFDSSFSRFWEKEILRPLTPFVESDRRETENAYLAHSNTFECPRASPLAASSMLWDDAGTTPYEVLQARSRKPALADENRLLSSVIHHPPKFDTQLAEPPFKNGVPVIASFNCSSLNVDTSVRNPEDSLEFAMINALTGRIEQQNQTILDQRALIAQLSASNTVYKQQILEMTEMLLKNNQSQLENRSLVQPEKKNASTMTDPHETIIVRNVLRLVSPTPGAPAAEEPSNSGQVPLRNPDIEEGTRGAEQDRSVIVLSQPVKTFQNTQTECIYFKKGHCRWGNQCRFSHLVETPPVCEHHSAQDGCQNAKSAKCKKLHPEKCKRFADGRCTKGQRCNFFHPIKPALNHQKTRTDTEQTSSKNYMHPNHHPPTVNNYNHFRTRVFYSSGFSGIANTNHQPESSKPWTCLRPSTVNQKRGGPGERRTSGTKNTKPNHHHPNRIYQEQRTSRTNHTHTYRPTVSPTTLLETLV